MIKVCSFANRITCLCSNFPFEIKVKMGSRGLKILNMVKQSHRNNKHVYEEFNKEPILVNSKHNDDMSSTLFRNYETETTFDKISEESIKLLHEYTLKNMSNGKAEMYAELSVKNSENVSKIDSTILNDDSDDLNAGLMLEDSDSEYLPSSSSSSEGEPEEDALNSESKDINEQESKFVICDKQSESAATSLLMVPTSQPRGQNKFWCCPFCKERVQKFARHLERRHRFEEKVKQFLQLPTRDKKRISIISELRNKGTYIHNFDSTLHKGQIIVSRRPQAHKRRNVTDYIPCPSCNGFYKKDSLHKHTKICVVKPVHVRGVQQVSRALVIKETVKANDLMLTHLIPKMRCDEITNQIIDDPLILLFGSYLCEKYAKDIHLDAFLRQKLRQLGRFLLVAKEINNKIKDLSSLFQPTEYDTVINAVKKVCGFSVQQRTFQKPVLALNLGSILTQCANFYIGQCIRQGNYNQQKFVEYFLHIHKIEYSSRVSRIATAVHKEASWNKAQELSLPQGEDIERMVSFLKVESAKAYEELKKCFNNISWTNLAETLLLRVLMFNRKRVGELERLLIKNYESRQQITEGSDAFRALSPIEQALSYKFARVEIRGKKGRRVPILLAREQIEYIDIILKLRSQAGVPPDNPYVFGKRGNDNTYRYFSACKLFRDYASKCGAKVPGNLRGTKLRKQIATICQVMELSENDVQLLADYLGHDIAIHKAHYRTPELTLQVSKVAKILIAAEDKQVEKYRGQCLNTLNVQITETKSTDKRDSVSSSVENIEDDVQPKSRKLRRGIRRKLQKSDERDSDSSIENMTDDIQPKSRIVKQGNRRKFLTSNVEKLDERDSDSSYVENMADDILPKSRKVSLRKLQKPGKVIRRTWITPEKKAVRERFAEYLENKYLPSLAECQEAIRTDERLSKRTPDQLKAWINNQAQKCLFKN